MTHQQIIDRLGALPREREAAIKTLASAQEEERRRLQAACAIIGHVWSAQPQWPNYSPMRACAICATTILAEKVPSIAPDEVGK